MRCFLAIVLAGLLGACGTVGAAIVDDARICAERGGMAGLVQARRVARDVKAVHGDVTALIKAGVINKTEDGKVEFPYDRVHVDFEIKAA